MKQNDRNIAFAELAALIGAAASAFIWYCERLQFLPTHSRTFLGTLIGVFFSSGAGLFIIYCLIRKGIAAVKGREWPMILLISLVISVILIVWFPVPQTGLYPVHRLEIRALPDEAGIIRPVTLTWLHRENGDVPLSEVRCEGNCGEDEESRLTLTDESGILRWKGKTGDMITVEFVSGSDQGIADIRWDDSRITVGLMNEEFDRLSFDHVFPSANVLPEFISVWILALFTGFAGTVCALKLFPGWPVRRFFISAFVCFILFRIAQFLTIREPLFFIDSESYLGMSHMSIGDILIGTPYCHQQYWYCIARPAFIPLVYKHCGQDPHLIAIVQLAVSLICWGYFANRTALLCRTPGWKNAVILLSLGLGCVPNVTRWDQVIMSESLSISAAVLLMGSCFWLTRPEREKRWKTLPAVFTALSAFLYAQSRDSAVWSIILIGLLLLCLVRLRTNRRAILILCAVLAGTCWSVMSNTGGRWKYPFENVLFSRIFRDPQGEQFFIEAGMPTPPRIGELYGVEHMMGSELFNSDEMAPLREWIETEGLSVYIRMLLRDPGMALRMAWSAGFEQEAFEQIGYTFAPAGFTPLLPDPISKFFSCNLPAVILIGLGLLGIIRAFRSENGERFSFPVLFVLTAYILCSGVILADEYEFQRHSMVILLMMKAAAWPLICLILEGRSLRR